MGKTYSLESRDRWRTPIPLMRAMDARFRFAADVAATELDCAVFRVGRPCELCVKGEHFPVRSAFDPGRWPSPWFINPPYSQKGRGDDPTRSLEDWVELMVYQATENRTVGMAVLPGDPSVGWWRTAYAAAHEVRTLVMRIPFEDDEGNPTKGNRGGTALFTFGPRMDLSPWHGCRIK